MILIPQKWSCLPVAFARALDISFSEFIERVGHDGSEQVYKDLKFRRGFHVQECIDIAERMGVTCVPIEHHYASTPTGLETYLIGTLEEQSQRFSRYLDETPRGVLQGVRLNSKQQTIGHACAWVGDRVYDSNTSGNWQKTKSSPYKFQDRLLNSFCVNTLWRLRW